LAFSGPPGGWVEGSQRFATAPFASYGPEKIKIIVTNSSTNTIEVLGGLYASNAKTSTSGFNPFGSGDIVYSFAAIIDSAQNIAKQNMALSDAAITSVDSTFWDTYPISTAFQNGFIKYARTASGSELNCTTLGYALRGDPTYGFTPVTGNENVPSNVCSTNTSFTDAQMDQALQNYINQICKTFTAGLCGLKYVYNMKNAQCLDKDGFYGAGAICSTDAPFSGLTLDKLPLIPFDIKNLSLSDISCTTDIGEVDVTYP